MVEPANGKTTKYALADVPDFIDGAVSPEAVSLQNSLLNLTDFGTVNLVNLM